MGSKRGELVSVLLLMIIFSILSPNIVKTVTANSEDYKPLLSMPKEYINYTIVLDQQGTLWAIVDGYYPINLLDNFTGNLPLLYPMPPQTTNISVSVNDMQIDWSNFTQSYPLETHHTAVGDWWMIYIDPMVVSTHFTLKIHYEHPLEKINDSYFFLYDLNISPYLSPQSANSTAYFQIDIRPDFTDLRVSNTETDSKWNPIMYNLTKTDSSSMISIEASSEYGKPLLGDLVVEFSIKQVSEFPWVVFAVVVAVIAVAGLLVYFKKHKRVKTL
jgi:hypothetical protein